jgi:vacuolar protein sorting-associated protein 13A/C
MDIRQITFAFSFAVGQLTTSLFKSNAQGVEVAFADAVLHKFGLNFALRKYDMSVDVSLRSLSLSMIQGSRQPLPILYSDEGSTAQKNDLHELLRVKYAKVQKASPEFMTVHEGVDQNISVQLSTFNLAVSPKPILEIYDFIMTTFVPENKGGQTETAHIVEDTNDEHGESAADIAPTNSDKLRVRVKLTAIRRKYMVLSEPRREQI